MYGETYDNESLVRLLKREAEYVGEAHGRGDAHEVMEHSAKLMEGAFVMWRRAMAEAVGE